MGAVTQVSFQVAAKNFLSKTPTFSFDGAVRTGGGGNHTGFLPGGGEKFSVQNSNIQLP